MKKQPKSSTEFSKALAPREYRVFAGVIERHQWPVWSRLLFWLLGGHFGDGRDWRDIDAWADAIARSLRALAVS